MTKEDERMQSKENLKYTDKGWKILYEIVRCQNLAKKR